MILETIRSCTAALNNVNYGVNRQITSMSFDGSDTTPTLLPSNGIVDETSNDQVAVGRYPEVSPCLVVTLDGSVQLDGEVVSNYRDAEVTLLIRYVSRDSEHAKGRSDSYYTLKAIQKVVRQWMSNENSSDRIRNNVQIIECLNIEHVQMFELIDDIIVTGGIHLTLKVRDIDP